MNQRAFSLPLRGIIAPMVTPLSTSGGIDPEALQRLIEHLLAGGISGIFVLGTTGEGPALSYALRRELIRLTCAFVKGRAPVLVGISDTCYEESRALGAFAADAGADAVVTTPPWYFAVSQDDISIWIERLSAQLPLPLFLYNIPSRTHSTFAPETVLRASELPGVCGIKDSSGSLDYVREMTNLFRDRPDFTVLVGPEELLLQSLSAGAHGGVNGGANLFPHLFVGLYRAFQEGRIEAARHLQQKIDRIGELLYAIGEPESSYLRGLKLGLSLRGICQPTLAIPFRPADPAQYEHLREELDQFAAASHSICI